MTKQIEFEMPQISINRPNRAAFVDKNTGEDGFTRNIGRFDKNVRHAEVDALVNIVGDLKYNDGSIDPGIASTAVTEFKRVGLELDNIGDLIEKSQLPEEKVPSAQLLLQSFREIKGLLEVKDGGAVTLKNTIGDPGGIKTLIKQKIEIGYTRDENDSIKSLQISLSQLEGASSGNITVDIPNTPEARSELAKITSQSGIFERLDFSEAADIIVSAANQAAYKFEVQVRKFDQTLAKVKS